MFCYEYVVNRESEKSSEGNNDGTKINNFSISETGIIWQHIYNTGLSKDQIKEYFNSQTFMELQRETESSMTFSIEKMSLNTKKVASWGLTPTFLTFPMDGRVTVQCKDNRYRVTFSNIVFTSDTNISLWGVSSNSNFQMTEGDYAYNFKRSKFRSTFKNTTASIMNALFIDIFEIKKISTTSDDW